ncbi:MAG: ABC transporter ATP-binding protein [Chitinivibrionales bacterium]|nr:ABC transporter ATP-binding protein [Chitinivibrionales bacterium]
MSQTVITAEHISKKYRLAERSGYATLRDLVYENLRQKIIGLRKKLSRGVNGCRDESGKNDKKTVWALQDISFTVNQGDVIGLIGKNGSGKSTLLKILSKITAPTSGRAVLRGRVGSLLEVGIGFHPELTGHENIYLYGAILGMNRWEITRKFDEIVAFAGLEKFIDTTVRHYSSGMYLRLAFAVAAHLETEILLVDEVLAVGDAQFQKKCLGKIGAISKEGRTIFFVSHNMVAVRNLCTKVLWIQNGRMHRSGDTAEVTESYLKEVLRADTIDDLDKIIHALPPDPVFRLRTIRILQDGRPGTVVVNNKPVEVEIGYSVLQSTPGFRVLFDILDDERNILVRSYHDDAAQAPEQIPSGDYVSRAIIPAHFLAPLEYEINVNMIIVGQRWCTPGGIGIPLLVENTGTVNRAYPHYPIRSKLLPFIDWKTQRV